MVWSLIVFSYAQQQAGLGSLYLSLAPIAGRSSFAALSVYVCLEKLGMINLWNEQLFHSLK